jgi:hypothetical protein
MDLKGVIVDNFLHTSNGSSLGVGSVAGRKMGSFVTSSVGMSLFTDA